MSNLTQASWITLIGMSLTFFGIIVLWGLMILLVNLFDNRKKNFPDNASVLENEVDELHRKRQAAVAAVAYVMELQTTSISRSTHKERERISAWQAGHRSHQMFNKSWNLPKNSQGR